MGAGDRRAGDGGVADAAAADDRHGVTALDRAGVDGGAEAGHDAAADEARGFGAGGRVDLHRLTGRHQRELGERADAERGRQLRAVAQGHRLGGVARCEAVPGTSPSARTALAARRPPGDHHVVARRQSGNPGPDRLDGAGRLVAEEERELVVDGPLPVVQVGVAHPAGLDPHQRLAGARIGDDDRLHLHRRSLGRRDHASHLMAHGPEPTGIPGDVPCWSGGFLPSSRRGQLLSREPGLPN